MLGKKPSSLVETGLDIFAPAPTVNEEGEVSIADHFGEGKAFPGGPVCEFRGNKIPTLVQWSEHGGITGDILTNILVKMDDCGAIDRTDDSVKPFLLVDAHNSRLSVEFLKYINDDEHKWFVYIGVPYGTHLWQVADAEQLNGELTRLFTMAKEALLRRKTHHGLAPSITRTNVMPMFGPAWKQSFGDVSKNLKAMSARGWSVMNYALLDHPEVTKSKTVDDIKCEYTEVFGKHHGQVLPSNNELEKQLATEKSNSKVLAPNRPSQTPVGTSDLNFTGGMGKRVIDDIITGDLALQARSTVRKRAKLQDETSELFKQSKH